VKRFWGLGAAEFAHAFGMALRVTAVVAGLSLGFSVLPTAGSAASRAVLAGRLLLLTPACSALGAALVYCGAARRLAREDRADRGDATEGRARRHPHRQAGHWWVGLGAGSVSMAAAIASLCAYALWGTAVVDPNVSGLTDLASLARTRTGAEAGFVAGPTSDVVTSSSLCARIHSSGAIEPLTSARCDGPGPVSDNARPWNLAVAACVACAGLGLALRAACVASNAACRSKPRRRSLIITAVASVTAWGGVCALLTTVLFCAGAAAHAPVVLAVLPSALILFASIASAAMAGRRA